MASTHRNPLAGDPDLLFLDEPTTGLDPQSRRQLWTILTRFREAGGTVLLTTHYMDEAERLCDRVAIVDKGLVIKLGTPRALIAEVCGDHVIEFSLQNGDADLTWLNALPTVTAVRQEPDLLNLTAGEPHVALPALLEGLRSHQLELASLTTRHPNLEDVFVALTGRR